MANRREKAIERLRIIVARKFNIPPDDIDMISIINCVERAIREECEEESRDETHTISPKTKREVEAVVDDYGHRTIQMMFSREAPFYDWVDRYEEFYLRSFIEQLNREDK